MFKRGTDLRREARETLKEMGWKSPVLFVLMYEFLSLIIATLIVTRVGSLATFLTAGAFNLGISTYFLGYSRMKEMPFETLFSGFKNYVSSLVLFLLVYIFIILGFILFIIPGIIAALNYSQAYYILSENPEMGAFEALRRSKEMMQGHRIRFFLLQLSFLGWAILCLCTLGIGLLWLCPYVNITNAKFYDDLRGMEYYTGNTQVSL